MFIVKRNKQLDIQQTAIVNAKQWLRDNGPAIVAKVDHIFTDH